jgi:Tfp pilus assembly protein PilE
MRKTHKNQKGMTLISFIVAMVIIAFFTMIILKVGPIYMNHSKVVHALETLKNRPDIEEASKHDVWISLSKQFNMNYIANVTKKDVKITSRPGYLKVQIVYFVKVPFIDTLSIWVDFDNTIEVGTE